MKYEMPDALRTMIAETYTGNSFEPASSKLFTPDGCGTQIWVFEEDVEWQKQNWRCLIVTREVYDPDRPEEILYTEDVLALAWPL